MCWTELSNWATCHHGIAHLQVDDGRDDLHVLMVPENTCVSNKERGQQRRSSPPS